DRPHAASTGTRHDLVCAAGGTCRNPAPYAAAYARRQASTLERPSFAGLLTHMWMRASPVRIAHVQLHRREILANLSAVRIAGCPTSMVGGLECPCFR